MSANAAAIKRTDWKVQQSRIRAILRTLDRWLCPRCDSYYTAPAKTGRTLGNSREAPKDYDCRKDLNYRGRSEHRRCFACGCDYSWDREVGKTEIP